MKSKDNKLDIIKTNNNHKKHKYKVVAAKRPVVGGYKNKFILVDNHVPIYKINQWLDSMHKETTTRKYAYSIKKFLEYLSKINVNYKDITKQTIRGYLKHLLYGDEEDNIINIQGQKSYTTLRIELAIIKSLYKWLDEYSSSNIYSEIYNTDFLENIKHENSFKRKRNYRKWYSKKDIDIISSNFYTIRDKVIFLISIEGGCRIDEILSLNYEDYDGIEEKISIRKSKTALREIYLPSYLCKEIDRYIDTERRDIEINKGILEPLFVNLRKGNSFGERVKYHNYLQILKNAASRGGYNPNKIITHSGRATKTQELIESQVLHPETGVTDTFIMDQMGWSDIKTVQSYKKQINIKIQKETMKKVKKRT